MVKQEGTFGLPPREARSTTIVRENRSYAGNNAVTPGMSFRSIVLLIPTAIVGFGMRSCPDRLLPGIATCAIIRAR